MHVMFTRPYDKFNKIEDVNIVFRKFNFWRHHTLVGWGQCTKGLQIF